MKVLLMSDLISLKKLFVSQIFISLVICVGVGIGSDSLYVVIPVIGFFVPFSLVFTLLAYDERNNWEAFRLTLPLSRAQVIRGRYASGLILALVCTLVGVAMFGLLMLFIQVTQSFLPLGGLIVNIKWQPILAVAAAGMSSMAIMFSIILPLVSRFGMTKAVRWVPLGIVILGALIYASIAFTGAEKYFVEFISFMKTDAGILTFSILASIAALTIYGISCIIPTRLYRTREL